MHSLNFILEDYIFKDSRKEGKVVTRALEVKSINASGKMMWSHNIVFSTGKHKSERAKFLESLIKQSTALHLQPAKPSLLNNWPSLPRNLHRSAYICQNLPVTAPAY